MTGGIDGEKQVVTAHRSIEQVTMERACNLADYGRRIRRRPGPYSDHPRSAQELCADRAANRAQEAVGRERERRIPLLLVLRAEGACGSTCTEWLGYPSELGWALQRCPNP